MHTVVNLFIKPMTNGYSGMRGLALTLNAEEPKKVQKFVSHTWKGRYEDFVETLNMNMLPETVVFICSFALPQNLDVGPILETGLENTPFAMAHNVASDVWLIIDHSIDVIERVWVIYEMYLSLHRNKRIHMGFTKKGEDFHKQVMEKVQSLDVREAGASKAADKAAILEAITGMEDKLNAEIKVMLAEKVHQQVQQERVIRLAMTSNANRTCQTLRQQQQSSPPTDSSNVSRRIYTHARARSSI